MNYVNCNCFMHMQHQAYLKSYLKIIMDLFLKKAVPRTTAHSASYTDGQ